MTRPFNQTFHCPQCRTTHMMETVFSRWMREHDLLDSDNGFCVTDQDYWNHQFAIDSEKDRQNLIFIEVKTCGRTMSRSQADTLSIADQLMIKEPTRVWSPASEMHVTAQFHGMHTLTGLFCSCMCSPE